MWGGGSGSGSLGWDPGLVVFKGGGRGRETGGRGAGVPVACFLTSDK